jgi:phosphatidylglycerophosphate synthase
VVQHPPALLPALLIMAREVIVSGLREALGSDRELLKVTRLAKWKTAVQMVAILTLIAAPGLPSGVVALGDLLLWVAAALTVWTGVDYFRKGWAHLSS